MKVLKEVTLFKNHGGKTGDWKIQAVVAETRELNPPAHLVISHTKVIGGAAVTKEVPVEGKNIGRANQTTPAQQAVMELDSRVNKQLDKGYVRTLEEASAPATNALGLEKPMLAHPIDKVKPEAIDWDNAFAQPKLDGHRCLFKGGVLYSRNGKVINLPHIVEAIEARGLADLHLDGELYIHGMLLQDIGSLVKKPREESRKLQYHIYDVVAPLPYEQRRQLIEDRINNTEAPVLRVDTAKVGNRAGLTVMHKTWLAAGYEGSILRHGMAPYETDKRSSSLLKVKDFSDAEAIVIAVERGTPNGEFEVPVWTLQMPCGRTFKATAHGNAQQKHAQWEMRHTYMGRPLTYQHFGHSKDGIPLLPVALRWREDV
ncbi:hypothetical protein [Stutzerimonas stutzeri]|uniref:ATP-dependent DNA ligase family profile domain-containing protein n=1 Tax=Stutzerimonas stutzeri TaxID=316 RepID=A0AA42P9J7_STUST|nr:hypothetical protein [Stutzerimonas stutzeri]MDH1237264.1 hypothetical protein [Stutzerimonas stutzeri]